MQRFSLLVLAFYAFSARGFSTRYQVRKSRVMVTNLSAAGQGFGKDKQRPTKTYGNPIIRDVIDTEAAMSHFFASREEWKPLFRWLAMDESCPAAESHLGGDLLDDLDFHEDSSPWKKLEGIPQNENDRGVLASFLDDTQSSLLSIPVNDSEEDEDDIEFIEEGRRLLALQRFHVLRSTSVLDDVLFETVWNELTHLSKVMDEEHTGTLILLPDCDLADIRRFTDMNVVRPLEWLGLDSLFEVSAFSRGIPAIRFFYKLNDIPMDSYHDTPSDDS